VHLFRIWVESLPLSILLWTLSFKANDFACALYTQMVVIAQGRWIVFANKSLTFLLIITSWRRRVWVFVNWVILHICTYCASKGDYCSTVWHPKLWYIQIKYDFFTPHQDALFIALSMCTHIQDSFKTWQ